MTTTHYRTCPLCEATCGLELTVSGREIVRVRGDRDDVFSHGYICPKGAALKQLDADPDRLRQPLVRRDGELVEATWDEAFEAVDAGLRPVIEAHGPDAVAVYLGNPTVHNTDLALYSRAFLQVLRTSNVYSASTVDQMPKQVSAGLMFGTALSIPVPDVDRSSFLMVLGANPYESNGSLWTAPDLPGRLDALRARAGRLVVVDPRRTRTAEAADEHVAIRPGTDALVLFAMVHTLFEEALVDLGTIAEFVAGVAEVEALAAPFTAEACATACGIEAATIRRLARELAGADAGCVYGRIGTCTTEFGTLTSWLVDVLNVLTANLDRPGGAMFPKAFAGASNTAGLPGSGRGIRLGRRNSRVRGLPEVLGELPVVCLAEEIDTPGDGQVRALVTVAGNPVLSTPDAGRLDVALAEVDFMVSVDLYVNETTRHADVILPGPPTLARGHTPLPFAQLSVRNVARYRPPVVDLADDERGDDEIMLRLAAIVAGAGPDADVAAFDDLAARQLLNRAVQTPASNVSGRDVDELMKVLAADGRRGSARLLDIMVRTGPYGDGFGADLDGLTLARIEAAPHGIDLGALRPRLPELLRTPSGRVEMAPPQIVADVPRLETALAGGADPTPVLVGRRDLRSNNSWMHNVEVLVSGPTRCTLHVHPEDAAASGLVDGGRARVTSASGSVEADVEVTDAVRAGVVSLPHGWGHDLPGTRQRVAAAHPGTNFNVLSDSARFDPLSGNAALNAIPVTLAPA